MKRVGEAAVNMAKSALDGAKDFLGIHSPSREFWKIGDFVVQGFAHGIEDNTNKPVNSAKRLAGRVHDAAKTISDVLAAAFSDDVAESAEGMVDAYSNLADSVEDVEEESKSSSSLFGGLIDKIQLFKDAVEEVSVAFDGGDFGYGALQEFVGEDMASKVVDFSAFLGDTLRTVSYTRLRAHET